ncbi:MAG: polysaccharide deacetylase family protein [Anaerolineales bacterium]|jgi:peptidoglycan/xylan/chitin deacetylase (PgdA/CDA1 family)
MTPIIKAWTRLNGRVLYEVQTEKPIIALTIDDGPDPITTPQLLDLLATYDAHATFFVLANRVEHNEAIITRMVSEGHELGNHLVEDRPSIFHPAAEFQTRFERAHASLSRFDDVHWFRPGSALYSPDMLATIERANYQTALGSIYPFDAHVPSSWFASTYILWRARPGSVIVLHDVGARGERTYETLSIVLPELTNRGYNIQTLSELTSLAEN